MCLYSKVLEAVLLGHRINAHPWLDIANFSSVEVVPFCIPTSNIGKCLFSHSLANRVYSQAFEFLPV